MSTQAKRQVVFSTPFFDLVARTVDGVSGEPYYGVDTADYVSIVALTREQELVLVRQFRPAVEAEVVELPSGHLDDGESPAEAAARELYEETGFRAVQVELLGSLKPDTGRLMNRMHVCFANEVDAPQVLESREPGVEPMLCGIEEFRRIFASGAFDHALQVAAVALAISLGKLPPLEIEAFASRP